MINIKMEIIVTEYKEVVPGVIEKTDQKNLIIKDEYKIDKIMAVVNG
jgi:hypothetical protein